jgi:hypothetical protein
MTNVTVFAYVNEVTPKVKVIERRITEAELLSGNVKSLDWNARINGQLKRFVYFVIECNLSTSDGNKTISTGFVNRKSRQIVASWDNTLDVMYPVELGKKNLNCIEDVIAIAREEGVYFSEMQKMQLYASAKKSVDSIVRALKAELEDKLRKEELSQPKKNQIDEFTQKFVDGIRIK